MKRQPNTMDQKTRFWEGILKAIDSERERERPAAEHEIPGWGRSAAAMQTNGGDGIVSAAAAFNL